MEWLLQQWSTTGSEFVFESIAGSVDREDVALVQESVQNG
jgi:hypothetical protein